MRDALAGFALQIEVFNLLVERVSIDSKSAGCLGLGPLATPQNLQDQFPFDHANDGFVAFPIFCDLAQAAGHEFGTQGLQFVLFDPSQTDRGLSPHVGWKEVWGENVSIGEDNGPLDVVLKLPDISGPEIGFQEIQRFLWDGKGRAGVEGCVSFNEKADQIRDIVSTFPERRDIDRENIESVIQVFPKQLLVDHFREIPVCGSDNPAVDGDCFGVSDPFELMFLQDAKKFDLKGVADGIDFVEKDRSPVSCFKATCPAFNGVRECSFDMAKEFAFEKALAECSAIDANKRAGGTGAQFVNCPGDQFFSGAGLSEQKDRC